MVPIPDAATSLFLPPLDKALVDLSPLLSWKTAYDALRDPTLATSTSNLEGFLTDDLSVAQLKREYEPFGTPTSKTKSDYESRTASINITASTDGAYNLAQIKQDALWLSSKAKIDEVHALRIVILEWRDRPAARILQGYTEEEHISIQKAVQSSDFSSSTFNQRSVGKSSSANGSAAPSDTLRHVNLLKLLLSERVHIFRVHTLLSSWTLPESQAPKGRSYGPTPTAAACPSWITTLVEGMNSTGSSSKSRDAGVVDSAVTALEARFQSISAGSGWSSASEEYPAIELLFLQSVTDEILSILQQLFLRASSHVALLPATQLSSWFIFTDKYGFFERIQLPFQDDKGCVMRIQALASLVSLQILKFPYTLDYLTSSTETDFAHLGVLTTKTHAAIHDSLWNAAQYGSNVAAPAALAWSIIVQTIKQAASLSIQKPDEPHSDDEVHQHDADLPRPSHQGSMVVSNELTSTVDNMKNLQGGENASQSLAKYALDESGLFGVVTQLSSLAATQLFSACPTASAELHARVCLLELLRQGLVVTTYCSEVVEATLAVLRGAGDRADGTFTSNSNVAASRKIASIFLHDGYILSPDLLYQSQTRYPMELTPFLELTRALVPASEIEADDAKALPLSDATATFTHILPIGFSGYEITREEEEANCIKLTEDLPLFKKRRTGHALFSPSGSSQALVVSDQETPELYIPRGTTGYVLSESRPPLIMWRHQHSTLKYIGLLLSTSSPGSTKTAIIDDGVVERETQNAIIRLISVLLNSVTESTVREGQAATKASTAQAILEEASDDLDRNEDIITVVSDIFESELSYRASQTNENSSELLSTCLNFFAAVTKVLPNRVWPILARSAFLGFSGTGSKMLSTVVSSEVRAQQQLVLQESITLLDVLTTDVLSRAVSRRSPSSSSSSRYKTVNTQANGTTQKTISNVMLAYIQQSVGLLQWFYTLPQETQIMNLNTATKIISTYDQIIQAVFCFDDTRTSEVKLTAALAPAADYIIVSICDTASHALVGSLLTSCTTADNGTVLSDSSSAPPSQHYIVASAAFFTRVFEINLLHDTPFSRLEERLFSVLPVFIRLYAADVIIRRPLLSFLAAMVRRTASTTRGSDSSLSYLASGTGRAFFTLLSASYRPLNDESLTQDIWGFLTAMAGSKQQTLITFVATGDSPKSALTAKEKNEAGGLPRTLFVNIALDTISQAPSLSTPILTSTLRFLCIIQQTWPGVTSSIRKHPSFLNRITDYLGNMTVGPSKAGGSQTNQLNVAHVILDILSLYIHNMRQMSDTSLIKQLGPKLSYVKGQGVAVPSYNTSLQSNLKKNFENRFGGCTLTMFKHVGTSRELGNNYFYDVKFANLLLSFDPSWSRPNGFAAEVSRANENLSLVEAQIRLMGSWKSLAIELSMAADQDKVLQQSLANTVEQCLVANAQATPSEAIFESLVQSRVELAQVLLQRLTSLKARNPTMLSLLSSVWLAIKVSGQDFEIAFVGSNTPYLRTLLGIVFLALQPHTQTVSENIQDSHSGSADSPLRGRRSLGANGSEDATLGRRPARDDILALLLEIAVDVVGKGFCSLATQIHEDAASILPSDFALITAIFRSILKVADVSLIHTQLTLRFADNNVHRYALALFSWSDRLLGADTDPVMGELSISFVRELTEIPQVAEFLATQGVLSQLDTAPLLNYLRERASGFGPTDKPARMHVIWARGVLPITLNVLVAVGESFAAEATAFLNGFTNQLNRAATAFGPKAAASGAVTLDAAAEVHTLSLIALVLDRYRASPAAVAVAGGDIPALAWDQNALREDLEGWINGNGASPGGRIVAASEREAGLARMKPESEGNGAENRLEEMVLEELRGAAFCLGVVAGTRDA